MRILLVEDDRDDAQFVEMLLSRDAEAGHDIEWVGTVAEGLSRLDSEFFDIALVDLNLPDASNSEAVSRLAAARADVPIVVLSGNDDEQLAATLIEVGAQDYVTKGTVDEKQLNRTIHYAIERKATEVSLRERATVDILTGLNNRSEFEAQLERAMAQAGRSGTMVAVLLIDLDHFKETNDQHGHAAGDTVLHVFGERLRQCLRIGDIGARLGGDEFAVLLENLENVNDVHHWVTRARMQLREPVRFKNVSLPLSMSIGAAVFPTHGDTIERILRCADLSMYDIKAKGRNGFAVYDEGMEDSLRQRDQIESEIRNALDTGEFVPHFQPQIDLTDGRITGLEAVCRWLRTDKVFALPSEYIPLVQNFELIHELGEQLFRKICQQLAAWRTAGIRIARPVSVKVDTQEMLCADFASRRIDMLAEYRLAATDFRLEFTADLFTAPNETIRRNIEKLADASFSFSIERLDIELLRAMPIPEHSLAALKLKKDQALATFSEKMAIPVTRAFVNMAREIGVVVIGEGVETARQFRALQQLGCDQAQGYFIARPMNPDNLTRWLRRHSDRQQHRDLSLTGRFRLPPPLKRFQPPAKAS